MRILHSIPHIGRVSAGPSSSVYNLCLNLNKKASIELISLDNKDISNEIDFLRTFKTLNLFSKLGISNQMQAYIKKSLNNKEFDIVHAHSLWMMPNIYPILEASKVNIPSVLSPRGTLSPHTFKLGSHMKPIFWRLLQRKAVAQSSFLHATSEQEAEDIRRLGFSQPIIVIPNGIDCYEPVNLNNSDKPNTKKRLLFLGRIHPIKGLDVLLHSWSAVQKYHEDWELCIAGPDLYGYKSELLKIIESNSLNRVSFLGEVEGKNKDDLMRSAEILILPSFSENFGMVVPESLLQGTPVITSNGCPWRHLSLISAGWNFDHGLKNLTNVLIEALKTNKDELAKMGLNGKKLILDEYNLDTVTNKWHEVYEWILYNGSQPDFVNEV